MSSQDRFPKPESKPEKGQSAIPPTSAPNPQAVASYVQTAREQVNLHTQGRRTSGPVGSAASRRAPGIQSTVVTQNTAEIHAKLPKRAPILESRTSAPKSTHPNVSVPAKSHEGKCDNPQCGHCGSVIIPSPKASFPFEQNPSITVNDWSIYTMKGPILSSDELDHLNDTRFEFPLPEMIFGNNYVRLVNEKSGAIIDFNTLDALDSLNENSDFKVSYYKEWLSTRPKAKADSQKSESAVSGSAPELECVKPYDWTYSTNYRGTLSKGKFQPTNKVIPLPKLLRPDPILFFDESILFEDELGDNGISMLSTKIRVMHSCMLLLCRFFLRVDDVAFRIRDTRVFIDFETNEVLREYKTQEASYEELCSKLPRTADPKRHLRDPNWVSQNMEVKSTEVEEFGVDTDGEEAGAASGDANGALEATS